MPHSQSAREANRGGFRIMQCLLSGNFQTSETILIAAILSRSQVNSSVLFPHNQADGSGLSSAGSSSPNTVDGEPKAGDSFGGGLPVCLSPTSAGSRRRAPPPGCSRQLAALSLQVDPHKPLSGLRGPLDSGWSAPRSCPRPLERSGAGFGIYIVARTVT